MHPFEYVSPGTVEEVLDLIARPGVDTKVLAGGQSLVPILNYRLARPDVVVDINARPLGDVVVGGDHLILGALTRHHVLEESADIGRHCPVLAEAAALIGNVRVRSLGTIGGSLAHGDPAAELPMVMVALEARLTARSARGTRRMTAAEFFTGHLSTALAADELLTEVEVPVTRGRGHAIEEFARRAGDFAVVAVTALIGVDRRGRVEEARLAYAGLGPRPLRATAAEEALHGHEPTAERLAFAARRARQSLSPAADAFVSAAYRSLLVEVLGRRALARATARAMSGEP